MFITYYQQKHSHKVYLVASLIIYCIALMYGILTIKQYIT